MSLVITVPLLVASILGLILTERSSHTSTMHDEKLYLFGLALTVVTGAVGPDQALVMRGRFPRCRFSNVVLWNHRLQTPPYRYRRVSLNRNQIEYERDGSFKIVVAHRDPGVPNWIDAAGLPTGMVFWRFLLPEEQVPPIQAEVVDIASLDSSLKSGAKS